MPDDDVNRPIFARFFARVSPAMDQGGMAEHRSRLVAGLTGRVIEVGAGNGLNFDHYPTTVTEVVAVEPEPHLRRLAEQRAGDAPVPIRVIPGTAQRLPAADGEFDAAVCSMVLCTVPDQPRALAEVYRALRPGGELRFLEHVRAERAGLARTQRVLDATVWPLLMGGCHLHRDTAAAIETAGFAVAHLDRMSFPETRLPLPASPHIIGTATHPGA
ncbi:MAG: class I SAM-dependent methyltransferase [Micromonosporaceae bacterium]